MHFTVHIPLSKNKQDMIKTQQHGWINVIFNKSCSTVSLLKQSEQGKPRAKFASVLETTQPTFANSREVCTLYTDFCAFIRLSTHTYIVGGIYVLSQ